MNDTSRWIGLLLVALLLAACAPGAGPVLVEPTAPVGLPLEFEEGFEDGLAAWEVGADVPEDPNNPGRPVAWDVTISSEQSASGEQSARLVLDGSQDDGTIWLARSLPVPANTDVDVDLAFWLWSASESFNTLANVAAYAGDVPPTVEDEFDTTRPADQAAGWRRYEYTLAANSGPDGLVWVAVGISVVWETQVTYFIDGVEGSIGAAQAEAGPGGGERPPTALLLVDGAQQESGIGTYCWTTPGTQGQGVGVCADAIGIITPQDPLPVPAGFTARFQLPIRGPAGLALNVIPVTAADEIVMQPATERDWRAWPPSRGRSIDLPLRADPEVDLDLAPGMHVLSLYARWEPFGDVNYGWLVQVGDGGEGEGEPTPGGDTAESPGGQRYTAPEGWSIAMPAGWDVASDEPGFIQDSATGKTITFESEVMTQAQLDAWLEAEVARKLAATEAENSLAEPVSTEIIDGTTVVRYAILSRMDGQDTLLRTTLFYDGQRLYAFYAAIPPVTEQEYQAVLDSFEPGSADVSFADLMADPAHYHGTKLCTAGVYLTAFEASALGVSTEERSGYLYLTEPAIWIEQGSALVTRGDCSTTDTAPGYEFCEATVCGTFEAGGPFGHLGGYRYQIR